MYARRLKLRKNGGSLLMTIPPDLLRLFGITSPVEFDVYLQGQQLVVDMSSAKKTKLLDPPAKVSETVEG